MQLLLFAVACACSTTELHAQRRAWNWYFGSNAGVTFANGVPEPLSDGRIETDEGCAVASSPTNGSLLFYTDGQEVRNSFHQVMPNGTGLVGDKSTSQSAMIVPWPGTDDVYAIFNPAPVTSQDIGDRCLCLKYSLVDMRRDVGFGDVVVKNTFVTDDITEHITATRDCDGTGWWIVVRKREAPSFNTFHLTAEGLSPIPVVSASIPGAEIRDAGQMHASPDGNVIVITSPSGTAQVYQFMRATGSLFHGIDLFGSDRTGIHYGAAFTVDSRYLYIASSVLTPTEGVVITRFDVSEYTEEAIKASKQVIGFLKGTSAFTPMQLGPDGAIYIGRPNERHLASIPNPVNVHPTIVDTAVVLTGICRSGLPQFLGWHFAPHVTGDPTCRRPIAYAENVRVCVNECVQLVDGSQGNIDSWSWSIPGGIPTSPRNPSPVVCFTTPGLHRASLTVSNVYGDDTTEVLIQVTDQPKLDVPPILYTCANTPVLIQASGAGSYRWSPSQGLNDPNIARPIATVNTNSVYTVVGTGADGCKDTTSVAIVISTLSGGPDAIICPGGTATLQGSGADTYDWSPKDLVDDPTSATPVARPLQTTSFTVVMTKGTCVVEDTVVVSVLPSFSVTIDVPSTVCSGEVVTVRAVGGGSSFVWSGTGVAASTTNETTVHLNGPTTVRVIALSGSCSAQDSVVITPQIDPHVIASNDTAVCTASPVQLSVTGNALSYQWKAPDGSVLDTGTTLRVAPVTTTTYVVVGFGQGGCSTEDSVTVTVHSTPSVLAGPNKRVCLGNATRLSATGVADAYLWQPAVGLDDPTKLAPIAAPDVTTTYVLTAVSNGCVTVDSTIVFVSSLKLIQPTNVQVCAGSSAEVTVGGATSYRWNPTDGLSDPTIPNPIASPKTSTTYEVIGMDIFGCANKALVRVTVIDTSSLTIRAATVTALAGTSRLEIPILVDTDPALLPLFADSLRADLVIPADVLLPSGFDRGRPSISTRGTDRIIRLVQSNVQIVNPTQRINSLYGTVLASTTLDTPIRFEKVEWVGITCPTSSSVPGRLLVTGCFIEGRAIRTFESTTVQATPRPGSNIVDVEIQGAEPGQFVVQLVSTSGAIVSKTTLYRQPSITDPLHVAIDMSAVAGGMYYVVTTAQSGPYIRRVVWLP